MTRSKDASRRLFEELKEYREDIMDVSRFKLSDEDFSKFVSGAFNDISRNGGRTCNYTMVLKCLWLCLLFLLASALIISGFKPVAFLLHKMVHEKLYYVLRPIRLSMVKVLPYLDTIGMDFLSTDCMLENPLLNTTESCPCFRIKYPLESISNGTGIPPYMIHSNVILDVHVLRNCTQFEPDFCIENFIMFPLSNGGNRPWICHEMTGESSRMFRYDHFFSMDRMSNIFHKENSWTASWEECPDVRNPSTFQSLIPPVIPTLNLTSVSTFTLSTKWGVFSHHADSFPSGAVVIVRILLGEARFTIEPKNEDCVEICSVFRKNPVLKQGDTLLFDQRVWNFMAVSWSDITFTTTQLVSFV